MTTTGPRKVIGSVTGLSGRLAREPLLQFLLLGAALFALAHGISAWREARERRIVVDAALVAWQRNLYHAQFGFWPDSETLETLIRSYIRDEALYREARRLGLGADDEVIRQRLIQKMEFVLTDAAPPPEPDEATLQKFLDQHADRYALPGRVSFGLLYFADVDGAPDAARARAEAALRRLAAGAVVHGDPFALGDRFTQMDADELRHRFGDTEMAAAPLHAPPDQWAGPFRSGFGWHLIRVTAREPPTVPALATLRGKLRADWLAEFRERDRDARIARLIAAHEIVRQDRRSGP